jgi:hypothetical protein
MIFQYRDRYGHLLLRPLGCPRRFALRRGLKHVGMDALGVPLTCVAGLHNIGIEARGDWARHPPLGKRRRSSACGSRRT